MRNAVTRATYVPTPKRIEKESKCDNNNDSSTEEKKSSINDLSNEETDLNFAQTNWKPLLQEESSNANDKQDEQENKTKTECKFMSNHQCMELWI